MLTEIHLNNFVTIKSQEINFAKNLNIITGETGAGKSLIIDAILFACGERVSKDIIRHNSEAAEVALTFDIRKNQKALQYLQSNSLLPASEMGTNCDDEENICLIRRIIKSDGTTKAFINGKKVLVTQLKTLSLFLIEVNSQHQFLGLLDKIEQRKLLDDFANHNALLETIEQEYSAYSKIKQKIIVLEQQAKENNTKLELLKYQIKELDELDPKENEWLEAQSLHNKLAKAADIKVDCEYINSIVTNDDNGINDLFTTLFKKLNSLPSDKALENIKKLFSDAHMLMIEANNDLTLYADDITISDEEFKELEARVSTFYNLARKFNTGPENLFNYYQAIKTQINIFDNNLEELKNLNTELENSKAKYNKLANTLSESRTKHADKLARVIANNLKFLHMEHASFKIKITKDQNKISKYGFDEIEFYLKSNKGDNYYPLNKIASGGELSRISLSIAVSHFNKNNLKTYIFDEVDVGIGGLTATSVAKLLQKLAKENQILCISHLPQIAASAHKHFYIHKETDSKNTYSKITVLDKANREVEIARLLAGSKSKEALSHAKQLLDEMVCED